MNYLKSGLIVLLLASVMSGAASAFPPGHPAAPASAPAASPAPAAVAAPEHAGAETIVVARVNGVDIRMSELMKKIQDITMQNYGRREITPQLAMQIKKEAIDRLVTEELAYQRAVKLGITVKPEVVKARIEQFRQKAGGEEKFAAILAQKKTTEMELWTQIERYQAVKEAIGREVTSKIRVEKPELEKAYEENRHLFVQDEKISITDVVFFLDPEKPESQVAAKKVQAAIVNELGGEPGRLTQDGTFTVRENIEIVASLEPSMYAEAKKLRLNDISGVLTVDGTLHVVKLTKYRPHSEKTREEVLPVLERQLKEGRQEQAMTEWREGLRKDARIEIVEMAIE